MPAEEVEHREPGCHPDVPALQYIDRTNDQELLQSITLRPELINEQWLQKLDRHVHAGSVVLRAEQSTRQQRDIDNARRTYEIMLGLHDPRHALHDAYATVKRLRNRRRGLQPTQMLDALRELSCISGSSQSAVHMAQKAPYLLSTKDRTLRFRYNYLDRLTTALGWQGDTRQLVTDQPMLLVFAHGKFTVIGQIAARFANVTQQEVAGRLASSLAHGRPVEAHLGAIIQNGDSYVLGQQIETKATRRLQVRLEQLYEALGRPEAVERLGPRVLKAYFRYRPPSPDAQKKHPHLQPYLPQSQRIKPESKEELVIPVAVNGREPWIRETAIPRNPQAKKLWLAELNTCIAHGSESLFHCTVQEYERILGERFKFFRMLGWLDPAKDIGRAFQGFSVTNPQLASPKNAVDVLNILGQHRVIPLSTIIAKCFRVLLSSPHKVQERIGAILDSGFTVNDALQGRAELAVESPKTIRERLERRKQRLIRQGLYDGEDSEKQ